MKPRQTLSEKWIKASIIGTIWAASEIVLGSFLHNLKIPFSSNILAGIGIILLISAGYVWKERGLYWRAGLICALMKTMSPSAVIFGPMVAIFAQSLMLELTTGLFGKNIPGFITGAMLATSWNLFHKIINYIIFYGYNIVELYANLLSYAQKQLNVSFDLVWSPILILLAVYSLFGIVAAFIGIRVGRKLLKRSSDTVSNEKNKSDFKLKAKADDFKYSVAWMFASLGLIIAALVILNVFSFYVWIPVVTAIVAVWIFRYKRAFHQILRVKFWLTFVILTMLVAFVYSRLQSLPWQSGIITGVQMNLRAIIIILGFSVLGTELYNPKVRTFFSRTSFRQLPLALELSFNSLPLMISSIPDFREMRKSPVSVIYKVVSQIDVRLQDVKKRLSKKVFIITGAIGKGKTAILENVIENLKQSGIAVDGILSPKLLENEKVSGYDIQSVSGNQRLPFLRKTGEVTFDMIGSYFVMPDGYTAGKKMLSEAGRSGCQVIVVDEVGRLETGNRGWAENINDLISHSPACLVFTVRDSFVEDVIRKWNLSEAVVFDAETTKPEEIAARIKENVLTQNQA